MIEDEPQPTVTARWQVLLTSYFSKVSAKTDLPIEDLIKNVEVDLVRDYDDSVGHKKWGIRVEYAKKLSISENGILFKQDGNFNFLDLHTAKQLIKKAIADVNNEPEDLHDAN